MTQQIQAIRGMNDILPTETLLWQFVENTLRTILSAYSYQEIRFPILEKTELFKRSIGEVTDVVEKEMYTFLDRNEDSLSMRPEGTAGCVRAGIQNGLFYNQIQRLWYLGPFFRYERPQKGRCRQFHQLGAEVFGIETADIDAELILLSARILEALGLKPFVTLQLNSLGTTASRARYKDALIAYFQLHKESLDEDSQRRLLSNPLRILDSKNPAMQSVIQNAPKLPEYLDEASKIHFETLQTYLTAAGLSFTLNPCLVRGLDYYSKTVFEWVTTELGAQGTVCAGGRYDALVEQLGGKPTPAIGFALGMERTILLLQNTQQIPTPALDIFFITESETAFAQALQIAEELRGIGLRVLLHCGGGSFKNQFKKADKSHALFALVLGQQEMQTNSVLVKFLRENKDQEIVAQSNLTHYFLQWAQSMDKEIK